MFIVSKSLPTNSPPLLLRHYLPEMAETLAASLSNIVLEDSVQRIEGTEDNASLKVLADIGEPFQLFSHPLATTVEEQAQHVGSLPGVLTKNLFFKVRGLVALSSFFSFWHEKLSTFY